MTFFKTLSDLGVNDLIILFSKNEQNEVTLFLAPKSISTENPLKTTKPIYLSGLPEQIDDKFFEQLSANLVEVKIPAPAKENKAVEKSKYQQIKELSDEQPKTVITETKEEPVKTDDAIAEENKKVVKAKKEPKVNNEKVLKEFMTSVKEDPILNHKDKIEELYANLSEVELEKTFAKKVRVDLDTAIRKEENIQALREKHGFTTKTETAPEPKMEIVSDIPEEIKEVEQASPNVHIVSVDGAETEQSSEDQRIAKEEDEQLSKAMHQEESVVTKEIPIVPIPVAPVAPPVPVMVKKLKMIATDGTYEQYIAATWTDELLIQHGKAEYVMVPETPAAPKSLKYDFPKQFDAPDGEEGL